MYPKLHLRVTTPTGTLLDVEQVSAFACEMKGSGALEILPGHLPLSGVMSAGTIEYILGEDVKELPLGEGILTVGKDAVDILVIGSGTENEAPITSGQEETRKGRLLQTFLSQVSTYHKELA